MLRTMPLDMRFKDHYGDFDDVDFRPDQDDVGRGKNKAAPLTEMFLLLLSALSFSFFLFPISPLFCPLQPTERLAGVPTRPLLDPSGSSAGSGFLLCRLLLRDLDSSHSHAATGLDRHRLLYRSGCVPPSFAVFETAWVIVSLCVQHDVCFCTFLSLFIVC